MAGPIRVHTQITIMSIPRRFVRRTQKRGLCPEKRVPRIYRGRGPVQRPPMNPTNGMILSVYMLHYRKADLSHQKL